MNIPNEEQFKAWLSDPLTRFFVRDYAKAVAQSIMEAWANGEFTGESHEATLQANADALARCHVWNQLAGLSYEDIQTYMQDDEPKETEE